MNSEKGLVRKAKKDSAEKHHLLLYIQKRYFPGLNHFLSNFSYLTPSDREDILQETLIKVDRYLLGFNEGCNLSTWIYRIARNLAINAGRKPNAYHLNDELKEQLPGREDEPEVALLKKEERLFVEQFLCECTVREQEVAFLYYYEQMKIKEVAQVLGVAPGSVKSLLYRVRKKLKEAWNEKMET